MLILKFPLSSPVTCCWECSIDCIGELGVTDQLGLQALLQKKSLLSQPVVSGIQRSEHFTELSSILT